MLLAKTNSRISLDKRREMKRGQLTSKIELIRQRILKICRLNSYQIGLTSFLVLVNNTKFPNFKEEINV